MPITRRKTSSYVFVPVTLALTLLAMALPCASQAQILEAKNDVLRRIIHEFIGFGGYWFTDGSATRVLGTPKFGGGSTRLYVRPAHRSHLLIDGGVELTGASDHWLPFSGGNSFSLTGASVRVSGDCAVSHAGHSRDGQISFGFGG